MIAIYTTDGTELLLKKSSVITINWISTAFNSDDQFLGSYSYPVALAYCPSNNKALGMGNQLENRNGRQDIPVLVRIFGIHWKRCTLSVTIDLDSYSAFLKIDNGILANILKNTLLTDIFVNKDANANFVSYKYQQVTNSYAETITYMQNMRNDTTGKYPVYYFPVYNPGLMGSYNGDQGTTPAYDDSLHTVNPWTGGIGFSIDIQQDSPYKSFYTPFYNLVYITKQVLSFLGYSAAGDFFTDPNILDKVIYNTGVFCSLDIFADSGMKLCAAQHLPAISISDFIKYLRAEYKLSIYFDTDLAMCSFNIIRNTLRSRDRVDISGFVSPKYSVKSNLPTGYELVQPVDSGDKYFQTLEYTKSYYIGNTENPTSASNFIGTLFMQRIDSPFLKGEIYRVPVANQLGNAYSLVLENAAAYNTAGNYGANGFDFRLLTYRGMFNDSNGHPYPYGSSDDKAVDGITSDYGMSLWLGGAKGILPTYNLEYYNFFLRTELVELDATLPMRLLQQITPSGLLEFRTPSQAIIPAMMNDITFEAEQNERRLASKMRVYPIYSQKDLDQPLISTFVSTGLINPTIYVKLNVAVDYANSTYTLVKGKKNWTHIQVIVTLSFFSDQYGLVPFDVTKPFDVTIRYVQSWVGAQHNAVYPQVRKETVSGYSYVCADLIYAKETFNSAYILTKYSLATDPTVIGVAPGYVVIGDVYGGYVPPAS